MAIKPIKVSQLNGYIKRILQTDPLLGNVSVVGEISNLKFHGSGHVYFSLKDADSKLNCFLPQQRAEALRYELSEGMEITASGYIYLYERGGSYSLNIRDIEVAGLGNLSVAFEKLKAKLEAEGIFDAAHKKPIPFFPEKIAVITSETGAAIRDILKIIKSKNHYTDVLIYPVLVQGPAAAGQIAEAIDQVNCLFPETDTIIVGRGGGSMEELWAFNEEIVARSIYQSKIPVISAVGHETDITIADFAADKRAETPTAAAAMAVPDIGELKIYVDNLMKTLAADASSYIRYQQMHLKSLDLAAFKRDLESRIVMEQMRIENLKSQAQNRVLGIIAQLEKEVNLHKSSLESFNPAAIMARGYSAVLDNSRRLVGRAEKLRKNDRITLVMKDGEADCEVTEIRRDSHEQS
ncbi:exodeoxyribonuclease VII large subunit [Eubacteriales bacterium DFI.9.88]|uniref:exodeoxyribonuclease VII large subunit n=1 Tax=Hominibacterium faecale TaxID=2839743 RepID=UPI001D119964|nr:exodeoxyribonuclease VII large subunit [Hominibacterium faecale]MCC2865292.1 exodeoxyribonuclease VII large subunit [Anaerovorax odorimutans]MDE8732836.1 exodeoxyribonuclease VII large subunit [Eubacteriales bacterium DFI.9.88]